MQTKQIELTGSSTQSSDDAVSVALSKAAHRAIGRCPSFVECLQ
ncbi:dodecin domain-containing protein [Paraburkholderia sp. RL17-347-BIC-D]